MNENPFDPNEEIDNGFRNTDSSSGTVWINVDCASSSSSSVNITISEDYCDWTVEETEDPYEDPFVQL